MMKQKPTRFAVLITGIVASLWIINIVSAHEGHKTRNAPATAKKMKNPLKANDTAIAAGQTLFNEHCASCHGEDGKAVTEIATKMEKKPTDLTTKAMRGITDGEIFWVITYGIKKSGMPAFSPAVSWRGRWQMTHYVKYLMAHHPHLADNLQKAGQKAGKQSGDHTDHYAHHTAAGQNDLAQKPKVGGQTINEQTDKDADFVDQKTIQQISVGNNGGFIKIVTREQNDIATCDQIRADLKLIEQKFTAGDFTTLALNHAKLPSFNPIPKELNHLIKYQFEEIERGGRLRITTTDQQLSLVIINFMNAWKNFLTGSK